MIVSKHPGTAGALLLTAATAILSQSLYAQGAAKIDGKEIQSHSFASQGILYSDNNNFLTMNTASGTIAFTDAGINAQTQLTGKLRVGGQLYLRNDGQLGAWRPEGDWFLADYRVKDWLGFRGGKAKSALGLWNDTQDLTFLYTWALLPQSVYPLDLRANTISHLGGDVYGTVPIKKAGSVAYTVYGGQRPSDLHGGIVYGLLGAGIVVNSYGGTAIGEDAKWTTPVKNLMVGASFLDLDVTTQGTRISNSKPYYVYTNKDHTEAAYAEYSIWRLTFDGEGRREIQDQYKVGLKTGGNAEQNYDLRGGFLSATGRINKWLQMGTYHSRYYPNWPVAPRGLPANHIFDQTFSARVDLKSYLDLKAEGHFMNGTTGPNSYHGFYSLDNAAGEKPTTRLLILKISYHL
jgi:hypothetical protein